MPNMEIRVAVIGNVDSGKSTLVGVLTRGMLDDGRGLARSKVTPLQDDSALDCGLLSVTQSSLCRESTAEIHGNHTGRAVPMSAHLYSMFMWSDQGLICRCSSMVMRVRLGEPVPSASTTYVYVPSHFPLAAGLGVSFSVYGIVFNLLGCGWSHVAVALAAGRAW